MISEYWRNSTGTALALTGSVINLAGGIANNVMIDPYLAREIWVVANPILLCWAIGMWRGWWKDGLGLTAIVGMYTFYAVTGAFSLGLI